MKAQERCRFGRRHVPLPLPATHFSIAVSKLLWKSWPATLLVLTNIRGCVYFVNGYDVTRCSQVCSVTKMSRWYLVIHETLRIIFWNLTLRFAGDVNFSIDENLFCKLPSYYLNGRVMKEGMYNLQLVLIYIKLASTTWSVGCGFKSWPRHTKDTVNNNGKCWSLLGASILTMKRDYVE